MSGGDRAIRWSTAFAVFGVAAVAAAASYEHAYDLVRAQGEAGWAARMVPLTVDGLIHASSMVLLYAARTRPAGESPRHPPRLHPKGACRLNLQAGRWRIFRHQAPAGQEFADPDEITRATQVATAQLNARAPSPDLGTATARAGVLSGSPTHGRRPDSNHHHRRWHRYVGRRHCAPERSGLRGTAQTGSEKTAT